MDERVIENIQELNDKRSKQKILKDCIKELHNEGRNWWLIILLVLVSLVISFCIVRLTNPVEITRTLAPMFLEVELAFFAVIFGAYAVFQALMRDEIIGELIQTQNNILKQSNNSFLNLSLLYIFNIFVSMIVSIVANVCPETYYFLNVDFSNILYVLFISAYCAFNFVLLFENINFVINLYRMFNVYDIYRALDVMEKKE